MAADALLDRYLDAVAIEPGPPSLTLLEALIRRHLERFPFASVGPQLGDDLPLDPDALFERIVVRQRGGYCFEQNGLMHEVLGGLGFDRTMVLARVLLSGAEDPPLTHRFTMVDFDGRRYLVDVGFGGACPTAPVLFDPSNPGDGRHRIVERDPGEFHLQVANDDANEGYISLYRFDLVRYGPADAELGHFYSHRHPDAAFVNNLVAVRILDDEVRSLQNLEMRVTRRGQEERGAVRDGSHLRGLLADLFDLDVSDDEADRLFNSATERAERD